MDKVVETVELTHRPLDRRDPVDNVVILFLATPSLQPLRNGLVEGAVKGYFELCKSAKKNIISALYTHQCYVIF